MDTKEREGDAPKGLIQVYTGDGKGKTTAALGLALRAVGQGMKVIIIQFIKGDPTCGEHLFAAQYRPFEIVQLNTKSSFEQTLEELRPPTEKTLAFAEETEIFVAVNKGLVSTEQVLNLMSSRPEEMELILTGRGAPREIIQKADLITEMLAVNHPSTKGIAARRGIED